MKQSAPSFDGNKDYILPVLQEILPPAGLVLEIGSGTGQHAAFFAAHFPQLDWQPTDLPAMLPSIRAWREEAGLANLREPLALDLLGGRWTVASAQVVICINTVHIVAWPGVENLFAGAGRVLAPGGMMYVYGAYRYATRALEPSNVKFDEWLKARDPVSGVRDFAAVNALAERNGLSLREDRAMHGNNRSIWWVKKGG